MLNQVMLMGRFVEIYCPTVFILKLEDDTEIQIYASENVVENVKNYVKPHDMVAIKGHVDCSLKRVCIFADKVSFLSSNPKLDKEEV